MRFGLESSWQVPPTPPSPVQSESVGCLAGGLFALVTLWSIGLITLSAPIAWLVRDIVLIEGSDWPWFADPLIGMAQAVLIAVPTLGVALWAPTLRLRMAGLAWAGAALLLAVLSMLRGVPLFWEQAGLLGQAGVGLGGALVLALWLRRRGLTLAGAAPPLLVASACVALLGLPWLARGALGSLLDTVLALAVGGGVGLLIGLLLEATLLPVLRTTPRAPLPDALFAGLVIGMVVLIVAAGMGMGASNLLLLAALPPLGLLAAVLARYAGAAAWLALGMLIGGVATAALAFFDPAEITLILGGADIPTLAVQTAFQAFTWALVLSAVVLAAQRLFGRLMHLRPAGGLLAAGLLLALVIYIAFGQPGFYGDQLFVVLRAQADLSAAAERTDRAERLRFVYTQLSEHASADQSVLRQDLDRFGISYTPYYLVNSLEVNGGPLVRLWLAQRPEVAQILPSPRLRPLPTPPPPEPGSERAPAAPPWNITQIGADRVWDELGVTGVGIVIGQSDSGVDAAHPDLAAGYRGAAGEHAYNWFDPWYGTLAPRDYGQHGSHTLGSAAGRNGIGVAPGATWFACANLARNLGNPARYLDCMQFMLAPHAPGSDPFRAGDPTRAAHVVNNSWGCPPIEGCDAASLLAGVQALRAAGIFVVASAGNEGMACSSVSSPLAIYAEAFSVGALDELGNIADFSSRGPVIVDGSGRTKPDLVAPGVDVLSTTPDGTYALASGTSMAGPHVAGVVALVWSANPALIGDIAATEALLRATAQPYRGADGLSCAGDAPGSNVYGFGVVDAYAAVEAALGR